VLDRHEVTRTGDDPHDGTRQRGDEFVGRLPIGQAVVLAPPSIFRWRDPADRATIA